MSRKRREMVRWMGANTCYDETESIIIVARAFKYDREQMLNELSLVNVALSLKRQWEKYRRVENE